MTCIPKCEKNYWTDREMLNELKIDIYNLWKLRRNKKYQIEKTNRNRVLSKYCGYQMRDFCKSIQDFIEYEILTTNFSVDKDLSKYIIPNQ